ncbi:MAG: hypothetical protein CM15mP58_03960 [Burkholderiaceae bacterium]|nr:MAG: hypothetical protein CM15mP58_03960 [Burkholderiaceae bacterium]
MGWKNFSGNNKPSKWKKIKATDSLSKVFDFFGKKLVWENLTAKLGQIDY